MGMWTDEGAICSLTALYTALRVTPNLYDPFVDAWGVVLFKFNFSELRTNNISVLGPLQADFVGYAPVPTNTIFVYGPAVFAGEPRLIADPAQYAKTLGAPNQDIYGWGVFGYASGSPIVSLCAKKFSAVRTLSDASPTLSFSPYLGAYGIP